MTNLRDTEFIHNPEAMHYCHYEEKWRQATDFRFMTGHDKTISIVPYETSKKVECHVIPLAVCNECLAKGKSLANRYTNHHIKATLSMKRTYILRYNKRRRGIAMTPSLNSSLLYNY